MQTNIKYFNNQIKVEVNLKNTYKKNILLYLHFL